MELLNEPIQQKSMILCCICGISIEPNPANMCVACLRTQVDVTENIPKQATIHFCKGCERYLQPPGEWIHAALESRELLTLCLKKLKGLNRVKLIDAGFVWTEPHSMRLKVKLTVQAEVIGGAVLQQVFIVEYTINHQMCNDCHRTEAKDYWRALVQVRQRATNKKTFYYLEQLILKYKAHEHTLGIKPIHVAELNASLYWRHAFNSICDPKQLIEYTVMDIEQIKFKDRKFFPGQGTISDKHVIADVWLVRSCDLGINDNLIHTRTHLGHILKPGDTALGYALNDSNINDKNFEILNKDLVPDIILTKKNYINDRTARRRMRTWKLKHMISDKDNMITDNNDYYEFLEDIEEDPEMRQNINIFKDRMKTIPIDTNELSDPSCPQITLEEMLDDLAIDDVEVPYIL
ncbi:60S ribosomal export protein NMD3 isoform X2 [Apis cerana]|uniref:60S ribosomal export protein NMD3 isoform X2 n=1 Tax=Apis cerana TaxID=7461 RepID=UPI002B22286A|nr:60S ribosomal export protein NMD3 isoform X2 [Apis cerana]